MFLDDFNLVPLEVAEILQLSSLHSFLKSAMKFLN